MGSLLSIGDTDISEDVVGSFSLHTRAVSTPVTDTFGTGLYLLYSRGCRPFHYFALVEPF